MEKVQTTELCPACGSGKIANHMADPDDGHRECYDCGWKGGKDNLIVVPIPKDPNTLELDGDAALDVMKQISRHLMLLIAKHVSQPFGLCIIEAGLCSRKDKKNLAKLLKAGCSAAHQAILQEADNISKEYSKGRILS